MFSTYTWPLSCRWGRTHKLCLVAGRVAVARLLTAVLLANDVEPRTAAAMAREGVRSIMRSPGSNATAGEPDQMVRGRKSVERLSLWSLKGAIG
jgi:hypothetical protein